MPSSIPTAVTNLVSKLDTELGALVPPVTVFDGQPAARLPAEYVVVDGVTGDQAPAGIGDQRRVESYLIACRLRSFTGEHDPPGRRSRAFAILAAVETGLTSDPGLAGALVAGYAQLHQTVMRQGRTSQGGYAVEVDFTVAVVNRIQR